MDERQELKNAYERLKVKPSEWQPPAIRKTNPLSADHPIVVVLIEESLRLYRISPKHPRLPVLINSICRSLYEKPNRIDYLAGLPFELSERIADDFCKGLENASTQNRPT